MPTTGNQYSGLHPLNRRRFLSVGVCGFLTGLAACIDGNPGTPVVVQNTDDVQHRLTITVARITGSAVLFQTATMVEPKSETRFPDAIPGADHPLDVTVSADLENGAHNTLQLTPLRDVLTIQITPDAELFISSSVIAQ